MLGAIIGAGASLASTFLNKKAADDANARQEAIAERNIALQKEFAQSGVQWKVEDAKKAGIHPLYALGASTTSFAPVSVGSSVPSYDGIAQAGQNIGRAIDATRSKGDQQNAQIQTAFNAAQLEGAKLDNEIKRAKLASVSAVSRSPGNSSVPVNVTAGGANQLDGQGDAIPLDNKGVKIETRRDATDPTNPSYIPGSGPSVGVVKNSTGGYSIVMPPELAESYESDAGGRLDWFIRNRLLPFFSDNIAKPNIPHNPAVEEVVFNPFKNQYEIVPRQSRSAERLYLHNGNTWRGK